jgi:hypothetical protein
LGSNGYMMWVVGIQVQKVTHAAVVSICIDLERICTVRDIHNRLITALGAYIPT